VSPLPDRARFGGGRLPVPLTSFVGREREVAAVVELLREDGVRLVTLTGPGGVGKTRMALRVAEELASEFGDGVVFVALAPVADVALVVPTVAQMLGVRDAADRPVTDCLIEALSDRRVLLLLDNFEHVVEAAADVVGLLGACAGVKAVVTSRAVLGVSCEQVYPVSPLPVPDPGERWDRLVAVEAAQLFAARAVAADPAFCLTPDNAAAVGAICLRLDGLPLALELAAAKSRLLSPAALLTRLERRLPVLTGGPRDQPIRLRTIRDTVAWSHDLLCREEQALFRRLAVFVGGFDLEAAEALAGVGGDHDLDVFSGVEALAAQSLLQRLDAVEETMRFGMLETVREFGLERLAASGEEESVRAAHAAHYVTQAERAEPELLGPRPESWLEQLAADQGNLAAALAWLEGTEDVAAFGRLAGALREYWYHFGRWREGLLWLEWALERAAGLPDDLYAKLLLGAAMLAHYRGDDTRAVPLLEQGLELFGRAGDERSEAYTRYLLGVAAEDRGDYAAATELLDAAAAAFRRLGDATNAAYSEAHRGIVALGEGDPARAAGHGGSARRLAVETGSRGAFAVATLLLGDAARDSGDLATAVARYREFQRFTAGADPVAAGGHSAPEDLARIAASVAVLAANGGTPERAARLLGAAERLREAIGLALAQPERAACGRANALALADLGEAAFGAAWTAGQAMTASEATAEIHAALHLPAEAPQPATTTAAAAGLSRREAEVLRLVAAGRTNREIADTLFLSVRTVERHVTNLYAKIGARGRADATAFAIRRGLA
jgi:predicted ATPase/DNA-binding CsgD family transcriptional regulator